MKKFLATLLIVTLLAVTLSTGAMAITTVNVRSGPGTGYKIIGHVYGGQTVTLTGSTKYDSRGVAWKSILYNGQIGWISSKFLENGGSSSSSGSGSSSYGSGTVYATANVNVRSGPGLGYKVLGSLYKGASLTYLGSTQYDNRGVAWYKVSYYGSTGWVSSTYANRY